MPRRRIIALTVAGAMAMLPGATSRASSPHPRLNHLQAIGTHNSYHLEAGPLESAIRRDAVDDSALEYSHVGLTRQLEDQGVRQLELDLFADPRGGRYASPRLRRLAGEPPHDPAMREPGTKVLHIQDYDYRSSCLTLVRCLGEVRDWSRSHPGHVPLAILLELKDASLPRSIPGTVPLPWTARRMEQIEAEIRSVFRRRDLVVPDDVRGRHRTLRQAVVRRGWPSLARSRGKVILLMDNREPYRSRYLAGHPSLRDRLMFTTSSLGRADAAFLQVADPRGAGFRRIRRLVSRGYLVRTRADADTLEARRNDAGRAERALASGAQWVSTDYPARGLADRFGSPYFVGLPEGVPVRCNPVTAPRGCRLVGG